MLLASAPAVAAPKGVAAKEQFDRGVKAYTANDFAGAADAMRKSYELERDPETLFAWAQAERKLDDCEKAIVLYGELLGYDMPAANRQAIETNIAECKDILAAKPKDEEPTKQEPAPAPQVVQPPPPPPPPPHHDGGHWWGRPVGDGLVVIGLGGLVYGGLKIASAASADSDKSHATTYADFQRYSDKATKDGKLGVTVAGAGGALVLIGAIWYATHGERSDKKVTGWIGPSGGGVGIAGGF